MTAVMPVVKPVSQMHLAPGSIATIPNVSWQEFESILQEMGEKRSARVTFNQGVLEIMVPLPEHEKPKDFISDLIKALLKITGKRYEPFGSSTIKKEHSAGVEPDACFYIQNYQSMIGRRRIHPDDPPPDLALEIDLTSKTTLDAYQAIGVPEVWIYDNGQLTLYLLDVGGRQYVKSETSPTFPELSVTQIIPAVVERSWQVGGLQALEEFAAAMTKHNG